MRTSFILSILIAFQLILEVSSVINFKEYSSKPIESLTKSYLDLIGIPLECPLKGALKNFAVRTDGKYVWYEYGCYSSLTSSNEFDESIIKGLYSNQTATFKYKSTDSLESLTKVDFKCPVDFALSKFTLTKDSNSYLVVEYGCVGVKSSEQTKDNSIASGTSEGAPNTVSTLSGLTCGDNTIESEEIPGTPLRGFKLTLTSTSNGNVKAQYKYSYHKLRSIENEKKEWASKTVALRNSNTQKN